MPVDDFQAFVGTYLCTAANSLIDNADGHHTCAVEDSVLEAAITDCSTFVEEVCLNIYTPDSRVGSVEAAARGLWGAASGTVDTAFAVEYFQTDTIRLFQEAAKGAILPKCNLLVSRDAKVNGTRLHFGPVI
ncbi:hypothetical protein [Halioglobus sp. HI00S01]|uniref:hypothetical protein n=1 Tax=Halioglobus sp. HI00S01 TaxID=1822214 RepID=UPI0012E71AD4|nr:hypothetical protein [Halioglobus sp. HI00S01]